MVDIDEAYLPLRRVVELMLAFTGEISASEEGVRSHIYECEIDSPVELDVARGEDGVVRIGTAPPLYYVDTTFRPAFHRLRIVAAVSEGDDER